MLLFFKKKMLVLFVESQLFALHAACRCSILMKVLRTWRKISTKVKYLPLKIEGLTPKKSLSW
jgi:hypothetical protein